MNNNCRITIRNNEDITSESKYDWCNIFKFFFFIYVFNYDMFKFHICWNSN